MKESRIFAIRTYLPRKRYTISPARCPFFMGEMAGQLEQVHGGVLANNRPSHLDILVVVVVVDDSQERTWAGRFKSFNFCRCCYRHFDEPERLELSQVESGHVSTASRFTFKILFLGLHSFDHF